MDALVGWPDGAGGVVVDVHGRRVGASLSQPVCLEAGRECTSHSFEDSRL